MQCGKRTKLEREGDEEQQTKVQKVEDILDAPQFITITVTFGDQAENHVGMQKLGDGLAKAGFSVEELKRFKETIELENTSIECELVDLNTRGNLTVETDPAAVLIIRNGVEWLLQDKNTISQCQTELQELQWDTKARMYGRIVNKHARHNLCFADFAQEPDYDNGKGRVVSYANLPCLSDIRKGIQIHFGAKVNNLFAEGNLYYETTRCGIGYHGDAERKIVVAFRLGSTMPLHYHWFHNGVAIGDTIELSLRHGDLYIMSEKATGFDWKKKKTPTLRHAAGCPKYLKLPVHKPKKTSK